MKDYGTDRGGTPPGPVADAGAEPVRPQLFCLPHAGGSAAGFAPWKRRIASHARVHPVELPGRGTRWGEPLPDRLTTLVGDLAARISAEADGPYVLYGHSFGALLAYELAHALRPVLGEPAALLVSGRNGPGVAHPQLPLYGLPKDRLIEQLRRLDGAPRALLGNPDLIDPFLPVLRADARLAELYRRGRHPVLSCPIRALAGETDPLADPAGLRRWEEETTGGCEVETIRGGHMLTGNPDYLEWVRRTLGGLAAHSTLGV
ncbi:thioesterase II family protein [Streptomyces sp. NPDC001292]|uniref:thioesterase II family protein n=1 Tax=Streptomyces sp. NPDC001292 TaxID=3364558 RepID=UPI00367D11FB